MKTTLTLFAETAVLAGAVVASGIASGAEIAFKNYAYQWIDTSWEGGVKPGSNDTALIPELPGLKARYDSGKMQSNTLLQNEEIDTLRFADLYGLNVNGNFSLALNHIVCDSIFPSAEDTAQIATNSVSCGTLALNSSETTFDVGTNHVLTIGCASIADANGVAGGFIKSGTGELRISNYYGSFAHTGDTWFKEGVSYVHGTGDPIFKGNLKVGGGNIPALVELSDRETGKPIKRQFDFVIAPGGTFRFLGGATGPIWYHEYISIDHGTFDGGNRVTYIPYNAAETADRGIEIHLRGAIITNTFFQVSYGKIIDFQPADVPTVMHGTFQAAHNAEFDIPDGDAPVDFTVSAKQTGGCFIKSGAGVMELSSPVGNEFYRDNGTVSINAGTVLANNAGGTAFGSNEVAVAAGATLGGTGTQVGAFVNVRGLRGNIRLNGSDQSAAVLAPGDIDRATGVWLSGTLTLGSDSQTNNVISSGYGELRCHIDKNGASCLSVNGRLALSTTDALSIVWPQTIKPGVYTLATFTNGFSNRFAEVTVNGANIASARGKVLYLDANGAPITSASYDGPGSIVYSLPSEGTVFYVK